MSEPTATISYRDLVVLIGREQLAALSAQARVAAGETTPIEECTGIGRTCAEVRTHAESELRAWQADGEDEDLAVATSGGGR